MAGESEKLSDSESERDSSAPHSDEANHDGAPAVPDHSGGEGTTAKQRARDGKTSRWWLLLPAVMVVEFWFYGYRGYIDVCVGKKGAHDFSLVGQVRTDENRWQFPRCESRLNLGLRSQYDERVAEATKAACRGATIFKHRGEAKVCEGGDGGWERRIETRHCPPWHKPYYEHLLWFLQ